LKDSKKKEDELDFEMNRDQDIREKIGWKSIKRNNCNFGVEPLKRYMNKVCKKCTRKKIQRL
jgi:hypothetical protein